MVDRLSLHRPDDITWGMALFCGGFALAAGWLIAAAAAAGERSQGSPPFHAGPPLAWLLIGVLALAALALTTWRWKRAQYGQALVAALFSFGALALLFAVAGAVYREASVVHCTAHGCADPAYPLTARRMIGPLVMLLVDLVAVAFMLLNAIDGFATRPILPPGPEIARTIEP